MKTSELFIYGEVGLYGISAREFVQSTLAAIPKDSHIKLCINSIGGDVFDGMAIYNALVLHPAGVTTVVDGLAASIGSLIAMAGKTIIMPEKLSS
jgi:ATP-dependent protease ClpP protease subunit